MTYLFILELITETFTCFFLIAFGFIFLIWFLMNNLDDLSDFFHCIFKRRKK